LQPPEGIGCLVASHGEEGEGGTIRDMSTLIAVLIVIFIIAAGVAIGRKL
jgi:hypothetical protein